MQRQKLVDSKKTSYLLSLLALALLGTAIKCAKLEYLAKPGLALADSDGKIIGTQYKFKDNWHFQTTLYGDSMKMCRVVLKYEAEKKFYLVKTTSKKAGDQIGAGDLVYLVSPDSPLHLMDIEINKIVAPEHLELIKFCEINFNSNDLEEIKKMMEVNAELFKIAIPYEIGIGINHLEFVEVSEEDEGFGYKYVSRAFRDDKKLKAKYAKSKATFEASPVPKEEISGMIKEGLGLRVNEFNESIVSLFIMEIERILLFASDTNSPAVSDLSAGSNDDSTSVLTSPDSSNHEESNSNNTETREVDREDFISVEIESNETKSNPLKSQKIESAFNGSGVSSSMNSADMQEISEKSMKKTSMSQKSLSEPSLSQHSMSQTSLSQHSMSQHSMSQHSMSQTSLSQTSLSQTSLSQALKSQASMSETSISHISKKQPSTKDPSMSQKHEVEEILSEPSIESTSVNQIMEPKLDKKESHDSSPLSSIVSGNSNTSEEFPNDMRILTQEDSSEKANNPAESKSKKALDLDEDVRDALEQMKDMDEEVVKLPEDLRAQERLSQEFEKFQGMEEFSEDIRDELSERQVLENELVKVEDAKTIKIDDSSVSNAEEKTLFSESAEKKRESFEQAIESDLQRKEMEMSDSERENAFKNLPTKDRHLWDFLNEEMDEFLLETKNQYFKFILSDESLEDIIRSIEEVGRLLFKDVQSLYSGEVSKDNLLTFLTVSSNEVDPEDDRDLIPLIHFVFDGLKRYLGDRLGEHLTRIYIEEGMKPLFSDFLMKRLLDKYQVISGEEVSFHDIDDPRNWEGHHSKEIQIKQELYLLKTQVDVFFGMDLLEELYFSMIEISINELAQQTFDIILTSEVYAKYDLIDRSKPSNPKFRFGRMLQLLSYNAKLDFSPFFKLEPVSVFELREMRRVLI